MKVTQAYFQTMLFNKKHKAVKTKFHVSQTQRNQIIIYIFAKFMETRIINSNCTKCLQIVQITAARAVVIVSTMQTRLDTLGLHAA